MLSKKVANLSITFGLLLSTSGRVIVDRTQSAYASVPLGDLPPTGKYPVQSSPALC